MGLHVEIMSGKYHASNQGVSSKVRKLTITNIDGPFNPSEDAPAATLEQGMFGCVIAVPEERPGGMIGPMASGAFVTTCDSRFGDKLRALGLTNTHVAIPLHDRFE